MGGNGMNQSYMEQTKSASAAVRPSKQKRLSTLKGKRLLVAGTVLLWGGLCYGGFQLAHSYITTSQGYLDQRISMVEAKNDELVKMIETQMGNVQTEMNGIKEELALTGETISGTDKTKQALSQRITTLDKQLAELKGSLKKLEDAARAF